MLTLKKPETVLNTPDDAQCTIPLSKGKFAIVDPERYDELSRFYWRAVKSHNCFYAIRRAVHYERVVTIRMHRQIAKTPTWQVCHHENHNTLDNRRNNLTNMDEPQHSHLHGWR